MRRGRRIALALLVGLVACPQSSAEPYSFELTGSCSYNSEIDDVYAPVNTTADGRWYYKGQRHSLFVYFDSDCDGPSGAVSSQDVWLIDNDEPSSTASSDLDGDGECFNSGDGFKARINDGGAEPPTRAQTWRVWCGPTDGVVNTDLTVVLIGAPTLSPTTPADCPETCYDHSCDFFVDSDATYTCPLLESTYGCNCAGCACDTSAPSITPPPTPQCFNTDEGATDVYGNTCDDYAEYPGYCGSFDSGSFSANDMCCGCGGGAVNIPPTEAPTVTIEPSTSPAPTTLPPFLLVSGSCELRDQINDVYVPVGTTLDGRWYYVGQNYGVVLYFDHDCDGTGSTGGETDRWIFDHTETEVSSTAESDVDEDGSCTYVARIYGTSVAPPAGTNTWRMACSFDSDWTWVDLDLTITETKLFPTTTPTITRVPSVSPVPTAPSIEATSDQQISEQIGTMGLGDEIKFKVTTNLTFSKCISFRGDRSVQLFGHAAASRPTLSGNGTTRLFDLWGDAVLELKHLELVNGMAQDDGGWMDGVFRGGAIFVIDATLLLMDCVLRNCYSGGYVSGL